MMTKTQNITLNCIAVVLTLISYLVLKIYTDFHYLQLIQKTFLSIMFFSGLVIIVNNITYLKKTSKKYIIILLICLGIILSVYTGFTLYLILALQNTGF